MTTIESFSVCKIRDIFQITNHNITAKIYTKLPVHTLLFTYKSQAFCRILKILEKIKNKNTKNIMKNSSYFSLESLTQTTSKRFLFRIIIIIIKILQIKVRTSKTHDKSIIKKSSALLITECFFFRQKSRRYTTKIEIELIVFYPF